ncbi:MAG: hypothetical protein Ctma_1252 [Catillopecten margaritatus gill symbiont]|uniref:Copper chaperone PCu(A)C n=1 Tax=Catillopecten margaritatus gill symbiont TaxID=3083288 RepID=A0AAU6PHM0_9GAMM
MNKIIAIAILIFTNALYAMDNQQNIQMKDFYIVLLQGANSASGYGVIKNNSSKTDTLMSVSSDNASVMLHQTQIHSGMANMAYHSKFSINANDSLVLKPMSYHLMLTHISKDIRRDTDAIMIKFEFKNSGIMSVKIPILSRHKYD